MLTKQVQITIGIVFLAAFVLLQGCGKINGSYTGNQPPTVQIVNVPQNAADSTLTQQNGMHFTVSGYNRPVAILSMQGTEAERGSEKVYSFNPSVPPFTADVDYHMAYDTTWIDTLLGGALITRSAQAALMAIPGGAMQALPDSFMIDFRFNIVNYYVFSYAPTIHWVGFDADGFVDHYIYYDVTDSAFIAGFKEAENNGTQFAYFEAHKAGLDSVNTNAMQARVYLLTASGDTTEHLFFVKSVDNGNPALESQVDYKTFYRSNNPPDNPGIKLLSAPDTAFVQHNSVSDTMFCLDQITPNWDGVSFNWRSSDPDDKSLYTIPLQYTHYLVKTPGDTLWAWSDSTWSEVKQIQITGLETGSYVLSAWCRDDGYTVCAQPATISFNVVKPTFEHHILLINETYKNGVFELKTAPDTSYCDTLNAFWYNMLAGLQGQLDNDNYVMDGVDVLYKDNSNYDGAALGTCPIPYSLIAQYKLVLIYHDGHYPLPEGYATNRNKVLSAYLDAGGRFWIEGRRLIKGGFGFPVTEGDVAPVSSSTFLGTYMQLTSVRPGKYPGEQPDFLGGIPILEGFSPFRVDSNRVDMIKLLPGWPNHQAMTEIDWFTRSDQAETFYTYLSSTTDTSMVSPDTVDSAATVAYGATPVHCTLIPNKDPILAVYSVENTRLGVMGEVESFNPSSIQVSYPYGQPWASTDSIKVQLRYDPISESQLKPVAMRYENQPRIMNTIEINGVTFTYYTTTLGYRTVMMTYPLFFMKNDQGQVTNMVRDVLNWLFYPGMHYNL